MQLSFGKYRGKEIEEIAKIDRGYLEWVLQQPTDVGKDGERLKDWIVKNNEKLHEEIRSVLSNQESVAPQEVKQVTKNNILLSKLDEIISLLQKIVDKEGDVQWK